MSTLSLRGIPLLVLALIIYNAMVWLTNRPPEEIFYGTWDKDATGAAVQHLGAIFNIPLPYGQVHIYLGDVMIALGLFLMGFEMVKATYTRGFGLVDRLLSPLLFVLFLVEFLIVPRCATSVFFFLTVMAGMDVVVGEVVGIRAAQRSISFGNN